ncbi:hypothetical protein R1sor_020202 [Riccia sorocarpa]|uniref:Uncharacterized protein n=1 Tax=Riccia sorocarpa TaxID=122646 RepID=A0ABD3IEM4_9MARC
MVLGLTKDGYQELTKTCRKFIWGVNREGTDKKTLIAWIKFAEGNWRAIEPTAHMPYPLIGARITQPEPAEGGLPNPTLWEMETGPHEVGRLES